MKVITKATVLLSFILATGALAANDKAANEDTLEERLKAVGELCMAGDPCAAAVQVASASSGPRSGEEVYTSKCAACHATGAANAPKFKDNAAWAPRLAKGLETLYTNAIKGINTMPAKGLCMDCSEDEIKASVDYMLEASK